MRTYKILFITAAMLAGAAVMRGEDRTVKLTLQQAVDLAQLQSVDAAVALNELRTAYWEYRTHRADQLPEVTLNGYLPTYYRQYSKYRQSDGSYTYVKDNTLGLSGELQVAQNIALTGGKISLRTALDFTRQLGTNTRNEFMSVPIGLMLEQPVFSVNRQKWNRRIEPVKYREATAAYMEQVEGVTLTCIDYYFNLLLAKVVLETSEQNRVNADKLYDIAVAKREIGHISESELMRLRQSALLARANLTDARSEYNSRMFRLRAFLNLDEEEVIEPVVPEGAPEAEMVYTDVLARAEENNSFAKNILRRRLEADYSVAEARGNRREVKLFASVGYTGTDKNMGGAYDNLMNNQVVELGISIPLLDWGKRKGKVRVAESNREVVLSRIRKEEMDFRQNIFLLVENFNNQAAQLEISARVEELAEQRYLTSIETFLIGKIDILDLNDAQNSKDDARQRHIRELYAYWSYFYNIRSITLYDFVNDRDIQADIDRLITR